MICFKSFDVLLGLYVRVAELHRTSILCLLLFVCSYTAQAHVQAQAGAVSAATLQQLGTSDAWLQLLHYDDDGRSAIQSADFFLAKTGAKDPVAELNATYQGLLAGHNYQGKPIQCRFPGRYRWLKQQLQLSDEQLQPLTCAEFHQFTAQGRSQSLSLIFATGFLGNPASYYGHLLLKVNGPDRQRYSSDLTATAVNFGADVPLDENMALYIFKGIVGGYDSSFSQLQYFFHSHNYGESEHRDLWEYELNLPAEQLALVLGHLFEVMSADFTYYFFNRNCAYRMAEVLALVTEQSLTDQWRLWDTPQAVVQRVASATVAGKPLLKQVYFYPSRQSRLYQRYQQLTAAQQQKIHQLVAAPAQLVALLEPLSAQAQYPLLDTLLDYYQLLRDEKAGMTDENNQHYHRVLTQRYQLPAGGEQPLYQSANRPDLGRKPSYLQVGVSSSTAGSPGYSVLVRPAYYDALDAGYGHIPHAALAMGELHLLVRDHQLLLRDFSLVKIDSVRPNLTGLPGDQHYAWYLDVGARQQQLACHDCLAYKARAGVGYAKTDASEQLSAAIYGGVGFLSQRLHHEGWYAAITGSLNWYLQPDVSMRVEAEQRHGHLGSHWLWRLESRWAISQDQDIRLSWQKDDQSEVMLSTGWYW